MQHIKNTSAMDTIINDSSILGGGSKLLSKKQAAAELGVSYRTIERWYRCNYINYVRIGGRVFISYAEIYRIRDQFIDTKPNGNYMESQIRTIDDIGHRGQHYCYGARR